MKSILCADDEVTIQRILQRILEARGYEVRLAANGAEVLRLFAENPADLVLLDVAMPVMNGIDCCKELRKRPESYDVPIIMVSGIGNEETITQGLVTGADDYILKPFQPEEILAKVAVALKKREAFTANDMGLAVGTRFVGRYDMHGKITSGGFSTLFLATDVSRQPPVQVALKIFDLPVSKRNDSRFISLFLREAYELAKLDHPNIVKLHEFGQNGHFYFLALEYLKGEAIDKKVTRDGPMTSAQASRAGYDVAKALQYLNLHRMVHRDVKPANVFITEAGVAKLVDFGLAKQQDESTLSLSDEFRGTPAFVSPEYILGDRQVDIRSDIYSLGVTLYYAVTSVILFAGTNAMEILNKHFQVVPPSIQQFDPNVNPKFSALIDQMLIKDRDHRPSIDEVVATFEQIIAEETSSTTTSKQLIFKLKLKAKPRPSEEHSAASAANAAPPAAPAFVAKPLVPPSAMPPPAAPASLPPSPPAV